MRPIRFAAGLLAGVALLAPALAPTAAQTEGSCKEYGDFVCCCTATDCECVLVRDLVPAGL